MNSSLMILVSALLVASQLSAQSNTTKKATAKKAPASIAAPVAQPMAAGVAQMAQPESRLNRWIANRVSAGVVFSTAAEISGVTATQNGQSVGGNLSTSPSLGAQAQYNYPFDRAFDLTAGLQIYSDRSIDSFSKGLSFKRKPGFQPYVISAGLEFKTSTAIYIPAAANWTIANNVAGGDLKNFSMTPQIGFQTGVGAKFNKNGAIELMYQALNYAVSADSTLGRIDTAVDFAGFTLSGKYLF